jgi:hypothetical protein
MMAKKKKKRLQVFFVGFYNYRNPGLGLMIKAKAYKGAGQE